MWQAKRMMVKLDMYRKFTNALAVTVIVSVGWICYEVIYKLWIYLDLILLCCSLVCFRFSLHTYLSNSLIAALFQVKWCLQWALAECLDHSSLLASPIFLSLMCHLCSLGTLPKFNAVWNLYLTPILLWVPSLMCHLCILASPRTHYIPS